MEMGTGEELGLERSELRSHLLHSQMGFPRCWSQSQRKPPAENQDLLLLGPSSTGKLQQNFSGSFTDISWQPHDIKHPDLFFFPWNNVSPSLSSLQDNLSCSCPQSNKHSALSFLQQLSLDRERGEPNPTHVGTCAGDRGVQDLVAEVQQLKSCLWYHKYESPKLFQGFPSQTLEHIS